MSGATQPGTITINNNHRITGSMNFYGAVPSIVFNNNNYDHSDAAVLGNIETNGNTTLTFDGNLTFDGAAFRAVS